MRMLKAIAVFSLLVSAARAGCAEGDGQCFYCKSGELKKKGACHVMTCAAATPYFFSTWDWMDKGSIDIRLANKALLVNGKPGYALPLDFKNDRLVCYAVSGTDEMVCNDSGVY